MSGTTHRATISSPPFKHQPNIRYITIALRLVDPALAGLIQEKTDAFRKNKKRINNSLDVSKTRQPHTSNSTMEESAAMSPATQSTDNSTTGLAAVVTTPASLN